MTIKKGGYLLKITATVPADDSYGESSNEIILAVVDKEEGLITFSTQEISYVIGTSVIASDMKVTKKYENDSGSITYLAEIEGGKKNQQIEDAGLAIDATDGVVTVSDLAKLNETMKSMGGTLKVKVTAQKTEGTGKLIGTNEEKVIYDTAKAYYEVAIMYETTPENAIVKYDPNNNIRPSTYYIHNASFVRLKNLKVGYTLPDKVASKLKLKRTYIYLQGQNLFTITGYEGIDPEVGLQSYSSENRNLDMGVDRGVYPLPRTFTLGVNVSF